MSGRDIEAEVLSKAARKLKECQDNWPENPLDGALHTALKYNQRIWSILQAELEKTENPLPDPLKLNLLRLSNYVDKRTLETIAYPAPEKLTILININQGIAAGLRSRPNPIQAEKAAA
jgi:flagellar protein FlaF